MEEEEGLLGLKRKLSLIMERDSSAIMALPWSMPRDSGRAPLSRSNTVPNLRQEGGVRARGGDGFTDLVRVLVDVDRDLQHLKVHAEDDSVDGASGVRPNLNTPVILRV